MDNTVLIEGGGQVAAAFHCARGLVDRLEWFRAPDPAGRGGAALSWRPSALAEAGRRPPSSNVAWASRPSETICAERYERSLTPPPSVFGGRCSDDSYYSDCVFWVRKGPEPKCITGNRHRHRARFATSARRSGIAAMRSRPTWDVSGIDHAGASISHAWLLPDGERSEGPDWYRGRGVERRP